MRSIARDGALGLVVGDVCGKGAEAAAVMGVARQTVRAAGVREDRPSAILEVLNEALLRDQTDLFCTACDVRLRPLGRRRPDRGVPGRALTRRSCSAPTAATERIGKPGSLLGVLQEVRLYRRPGGAASGRRTGAVHRRTRRGSWEEPRGRVGRDAVRPRGSLGRRSRRRGSRLARAEPVVGARRRRGRAGREVRALAPAPGSSQAANSMCMRTTVPSGPERSCTRSHTWLTSQRPKPPPRRGSGLRRPTMGSVIRPLPATSQRSH